MSALVDQITDTIFTETTRIVLEDTNDETVQRVAAIMSLCSKRLAERVAAELNLTEETTNRMMLAYDDPPAPFETNRADVPGPVWATHYELVPSSRHVSEWEPRVEHADHLRPWVAVEPKPAEEGQ